MECKNCKKELKAHEEGIYIGRIMSDGSPCQAMCMDCIIKLEQSKKIIVRKFGR